MTRSLGIDFGNHSLKIAEIEHSGKQNQIIGLYEVTPRDDQTKADALRQFFANNSIKADRISIGLNSADILMKKFTLPFRDRKRVNLAINGEWMDSVPFDLEDFYIETRHVSKTGKLHGFISGICPKKNIAALNEVCESAWIQPNNVLVDAEALASMALEQRLPDVHNMQAYVVVDLGYEITKIAVLRGSYLDKKEVGIEPEIIEIRHLDKGSREWVDWIANKRKVTVEEALGWLIHRAEIQNDEGQEEGSIREDLSDDIKSALRPILVELYQTLQHAKVESGYQIETLFITGSMCSVSGLQSFFEKELRVKVQEWPIFLGFKAHGSLLSYENKKSFATALSLAHSYASKIKNPWLNFKKSSSPNRYFLSESLRLFTSPELKPSLIFAAILLLFSWAINFGGSYFLNIEQEAIELDLAGEFRKLDNVKGAKAKNFVSDPVRAREIFNQMKKSKSPKNLNDYDTGPIAQVALLDEFSEAAPKGLKVDEFEVQENGSAWRIRLVISVENPNTNFQADTTAFVKSLESSGYSDIRITPITAGQRSTLNAEWKAPKSEGAAR